MRFVPPSFCAIGKGLVTFALLRTLFPGPTTDWRGGISYVRNRAKCNRGVATDGGSHQ